MKKLGEIRVVQERIATGKWQDAETNFVVFRKDHLWEGEPGVATEEEYNRHWTDYPVVGYYTVKHPSILAGTWEEFCQDIRRIISRRLVEDGYADRADKYRNFAAQGMTSEPVLK
jgi:hypothetical protein